MPETVKTWYFQWINAFPESLHTNDLERFYMFVHILNSRSKKERAAAWLEENLKQDCSKLTQDAIN